MRGYFFFIHSVILRTKYLFKIQWGNEKKKIIAEYSFKLCALDLCKKIKDGRFEQEKLI